MIRTSSETTPTMWEGKIWSRGNRKPVTLVRTVVARKRAVQPLAVLELSIAAATRIPATIPTRLSTTCNNVNADLRPQSGQDDVLAAGCLDRLAEAGVIPGIHAAPLDDRLPREDIE